MVANMASHPSAQALNTCPSIAQLNTEEWRACCKFFKHDPTKQSREDTIKLDGLLVGLFLHQAYAVYWMLSRLIARINGCFLADDMGVGKTLEFLGVWVVHRIVHVAWDEVQRCRTNDDETERAKHLPANQAAGSICPTNPFCIACPCQNESTTFQLTEVMKNGPVLMLAPANNVSVWAQECAKRIDTNNSQLDLKWYVAHKNQLSSLVKQEIRCDMETLQAKPGQERILVIGSNSTFLKKVVQPVA